MTYVKVFFACGGQKHLNPNPMACQQPKLFFYGDGTGNERASKYC